MLRKLGSLVRRHRDSRFIKSGIIIFIAGSRKLFTLLPPRLSFFWITLTRFFNKRISYFLASDFMMVAKANCPSFSFYNYASILTARLPLEAAGTLVRLGAFQQATEALARSKPSLRDTDNFLAIALDYFELGEFEQAKEIFELSSAYQPKGYYLQQFKALMALLVGKEELAGIFLKRYAAACPFGWCPHQNLAARYPENYLPLQVDLNTGVTGLLFDAYHFLGQRVTQAGRGELAVDFYKKALEKQASLMKTPPHLSQELRQWLTEKRLSLKDLAILPWEWVTQIGHLGMLEILFRMRELGWWSKQAVILAPPGKVANQKLLALFQDKAWILVEEVNISKGLSRELFSLQRYCGMNFNAWQFAEGEVLPWQQAGARALIQWEAEKRDFPLCLAFDSHYATLASTSLASIKQAWGMKPSDWYVCLHVRDSEFHGDLPGFGQSIRNADLNSYQKAIRYITEQGGWVVKLGGARSFKLPLQSRVINYAHSAYKSELIDLCLIRHARFFIGTTSGLTNIAISFNIPAALVNCISPDAQLWSSRVRFALKSLVTSEGKRLSQRDLNSAPWRWRTFNAEILRRFDAKIKPNSADEILETVKEVSYLAEGHPDLYRKVYPQADALLAHWRSRLVFPEFYGAALPGLYYLAKAEMASL